MRVENQQKKASRKAQDCLPQVINVRLITKKGKIEPMIRVAHSLAVSVCGENFVSQNGVLRYRTIGFQIPM